MLLLVLLSVYLMCTDAVSFVSLVNTRVEFRANETKLLQRTDNFTGDFTTCLQYRAFVEGKRTKLNVYLCHMIVGGRCAVNTIRETNGQTLCLSLRPWTKPADPYSFYFAFERRPRHWHETGEHDRRMLRHKRHTKASRVVGVLQIDGLVDCLDVCQDQEGSGTGNLDF